MEHQRRDSHRGDRHTGSSRWHGFVVHRRNNAACCYLIQAEVRTLCWDCSCARTRKLWWAWMKATLGESESESEIGSARVQVALAQASVTRKKNATAIAHVVVAAA